MPMRSDRAMPWDMNRVCWCAVGPGADKPTLPFVYSDEVWTGIEYQVASHLIAEGFGRRTDDRQGVAQPL